MGVSKQKSIHLSSANSYLVKLKTLYKIIIISLQQPRGKDTPSSDCHLVHEPDQK